MGFGKVNLQDKRTAFTVQSGQRGVAQRHVKILAMVFRTQGRKPFEEANMLHVGIRKDWLKTTSLSRNPLKLKEVKFTLTGGAVLKLIAV